MEMGEKIKTLRAAKNMTLEELGNAVGVGKSTVRKWENGMIANMRRDKIAKIAAALDVSPAYLMGWEEIIPSRPEGGFDINALAEPGLTELERKLIVKYRLLNKEGQERLHDYASDLIASGRYKKDSPTRLDKEA